MAKDALAVHAREELGISDLTTARPIQAAFTSALTFSAGAAMPLLAALMSPTAIIPTAVSIASLVALAVLGAVGAKTGGAPVTRAVIRVVFWGGVAMAITAGVGKIFGVAA
jgi:VIT1/CCC1 family predicted Fe2+/Mn2+ transporter